MILSCSYALSPTYMMLQQVNQTKKKNYSEADLTDKKFCLMDSCHSLTMHVSEARYACNPFGRLPVAKTMNHSIPIKANSVNLLSHRLKPLKC